MLIKHWPSKSQWTQFFKILTKKEKIIFSIFLFSFFTSALFLILAFYFQNTEIKPKISGKYTEGVVGSPRFINPIYAANNDVDRDLVEIIFSGLMKYDSSGKIIPDLAKEIKIGEDGKIYEVYLKENLSWHDGKPLTADDVIFTLSTIQNPDYKSPLRANYLGVDIEKINDLAVRFKLKNTYGGFLERLTFKIIPRHIWQGISPQNFLLTNYNLQPIGSGPYQFKNLKQDSQSSIISLDLLRFKKPYLQELRFKFFKTEEDLIDAAKKGEIDGFSISSPQNIKSLKISDFQENSFSLPRYFAVFFNPDKSRFLADKNIRQALLYGIDKNEIIEEVLQNRAEISHSPILPEIYGYQIPAKIYEFNQTKTETLLSKFGLQKKDGKWFETVKEKTIDFKSDLKLGSQGQEVTALQTCLARYPEIYPDGKITGYFGSQTKTAVIKFQEKYIKEATGSVGKITRTKLNEICLKPQKETQLKFTLTTVQDPILEEVAQQLKNQWTKTGVEIEVLTYPISQLKQEVIKAREYEMLLFGEVLEATPDPFPFWHSSQKKDPGLNLAKYDNSQADKLLEKARTTLDETTRAKNLQDFQNILIEEAPALFLYSPEYIYFVSKKIQGLENQMIVDPSKRFSGIDNWFIKTKRTWK